MQKGGIIKMSESLKSLAEKTRKEHSSPEETNETPMVYEKEVTQIQERKEKYPLNETWSQDAQDELEDFIEQQGIYIRQ